MKKIITAAFLISLFAFTACQKTTDEGYDIPKTYSFDNVDYSGQTTRLDMMEEITAYIKTAHNVGAGALDANKLKGMYNNTGNHFLAANLNSATTKQLKSKTILSEQENYEAYMDSVAVASLNTNMVASNGQAGIATSNDGNSHYLLNANGVEFAQIIEKGIMGACFFYQATNVYMGTNMNVATIDNETVVTGEGTEMEHYWDEAFGYFGVPIDFPDSTNGIRFWGKYSNDANSAFALNNKIMNAFLKGRAAISNKDIETRDEAILELRQNWELLVAATAIHYINNAIDNLDPISGDQAKALHEMSEVYAFLTNLRYGIGTGYIFPSEVDQILVDAFGSSDALQINLYNVTTQKLEGAKNAIVFYLSALAAAKDNL